MDVSVPSAESLCRRAKVLMPKFRLVAAESRPESLLIIFSSMKDSI